MENTSGNIFTNCMDFEKPPPFSPDFHPGVVLGKLLMTYVVERTNFMMIIKLQVTLPRHGIIYLYTHNVSTFLTPCPSVKMNQQFTRHILDKQDHPFVVNVKVRGKGDEKVLREKEREGEKRQLFP